VLVGAYSSDSNGTDSGAAYLVLGSASGISGMSFASADAIFEGEKAGDNAGTSVANAGDVNGDGYADIIVGARWDDAGGSNAGATYLILGSSTGISDMGLASADAKITGEAAGDTSGYFVNGAGDVNDDGYSDIIIGAYQAGSSNNGAAYIVLGSSTGISNMGLASADAKLTGESAGDSAGLSVSNAGDVNGDGYSDVIVGAYYDDDGGSNAGAAYVVLGSSTGIATMSLASASAKLTGESADDLTGYGVGDAGDINNDGYSDIIVGGRYDDDAASNAGAAYIVLGSSTGISDLGLASADAKLTGEAAGDYAGVIVGCAGDVNNDTYSDILVSSLRNDTGGTDAGAVYLVLGSSSGISDMSLASADAKLSGEAAGDLAGHVAAGAGDVNGDGYSDFLIGAYGHDASGSESGAVYLLFGSTSW
jgi:hypothetical protein